MVHGQHRRGRAQDVAVDDYGARRVTGSGAVAEAHGPAAVSAHRGRRVARRRVPVLQRPGVYLTVEPDWATEKVVDAAAAVG